MVLFAAPEETPTVILHLTLLDDPPAPDELLRGCDGPRLWRSAHAACRRQGGRTVWLWQWRWPCPDGQPGEPDAVLLRVLRRANRLLVDLGDGSRAFAARYQRQHRGQNPPPPDEWLSAWERMFRELGRQPRFAAIAMLEHEPGRLDGAILQRLGRGVAVRRAATYAEAMARLLEPASPAANPAQPLAPGRVLLADLGGNLARRLLSQLHAESARAAQGKALGKRVTLGAWYRSLSLRTQAAPSQSSLEWGGLELSRRSSPTLADVPPRWEGSMGGWFQQGMEASVDYLDLELPPEAGGRALPLVLGVGPWGRQGEADLADVLWLQWLGVVQPVALLADGQSDARVLGWAQANFPAAPVYPPMAIEASLRMLHAVLVKSEPAGEQTRHAGT